MKHLPIPFEQTGTITITKGDRQIVRCEIELATSLIEHFQGLLYRENLKENSGVAFILENPALLALINTQASFAVTLIQVDESGYITHTSELHPTANKGNFITAFQAKTLLMLPIGFVERYELRSKNWSEEKKQKPFLVKLAV